MPTTFVTAAQAEKQVTSHQARLAHAHTFGAGRYLLDGLELTMETSNRLKAGAGVMLVDGSYITVDEAGQEWTIENGTQAMKRIDLAGYEYAVDERGAESLTPKVLKGAPHAAAPTAPTYPKGSMLDRPASLFVPVAKVELDGISAKPPECALEPFRPAADVAREALAVQKQRLGGVDFARVGRVVYATCGMSVDLGSDPWGYRYIGTLDEGLRPVIQATLPVVVQGTGAPCVLELQTNGTARFRLLGYGSGHNGWVFASGCYLAGA